VKTRDAAVLFQDGGPHSTEPEIAPFDPLTLKSENHTKAKHEVDRIRITHWEDMAIRNSKFDISREVHFGPHFVWRGGHRGSSIVPLEIAMLVSYTLPFVTIVLSLTIRLQFGIECLRRSFNKGRVTWVKLLGCSLWSRSVMLGSAESEYTRLTNREIILED